MKHYVRGQVVDSNLKQVESGFVELISSPAGNVEEIILKSARVSHNTDNKALIGRDTGLIRYLWQHKHTSPFEHVSFTFHISCPMFVARQWFRHRTGKFNEISARYTEMADHFWFPEDGDLRNQSKVNHQCSGDGVIASDLAQWGESIKTSYSLYERLLADGVAREQARAVLPVSLMTRFYFTMDLHNLLHFLELRLAADAQPEIRYFAEAIKNLIAPIVPITWKAFEDFTLNTITFTGREIEYLQKTGLTINIGNGMDITEKDKLILQAKLNKLFV